MRASSTPLFRRSDGQAFAPGDVTRVVRSVAARAGDRNASKFGGRALRIGGATDLHAAGVHKTTIQLLGRWSSDIYRVYTRVCANRVRAQGIAPHAQRRRADARGAPPGLRAVAKPPAHRYDSSSNTWEPAENMPRVLVQGFDATHPEAIRTFPQSGE